MIIQLAGREAGDALVVQRVGRRGASRDDIALIKHQFHLSGDNLLRGVHKRGQRRAQRREPFAGVNQLRKLDRDLLLIGISLLIQYHMLQLLMRLIHDGAARRLIDTAGLHADHAVLQNIDDADTILAAQLIQLRQKGDRIQLLAIQCDRNALFKIQRDLGRFIRRLLRGHAQLQQLVVVRRIGGVFQFQSFVADVPDVTVAAIAVALLHRALYAVSLTIGHLILTRLHIPDSPGSDDLKLGRQCLDRQLETHLVITLAGAAVADRISAFLQRDIYQYLGDQGTRHRSAQHVGALIDSASLQRGVDIVRDKLFRHILQIELGSTALQRALFQTICLLALSHVNAGSNYITIIVLLQPGNDYRRVQAARVSQYNLHLLIHHNLLQKCKSSKIWF